VKLLLISGSLNQSNPSQMPTGETINTALEIADLRILVVDDEPDARRLLTILEEWSQSDNSCISCGSSEHSNSCNPMY